MALVLDTHAVIWYLSGSRELSPIARTIIATAEQNADDIFVSAISLVEIIYLTERGRLPREALKRLEHALKDRASSLLIAPLNTAVADAVKTISRAQVPEMPDRIIAATAVFLNAELVTRDRQLQAALGNRAIW